MPQPEQRQPTIFEKRVYNLISKIPKGKVTTYKLLAEALNCNSAQAIGQALKRNPYAPEVPCHRVIRTNLTLGGYAGELSGEKVIKKTKLLTEEGVHFDTDGMLITKNALLHSFK